MPETEAQGAPLTDECSGKMLLIDLTAASGVILGPPPFFFFVMPSVPHTSFRIFMNTVYDHSQFYDRVSFRAVVPY